MEILEKYFGDFSDEQYRQWQALAGLYQEWNEKINVISRKDIDQLYTRHILHSLAMVPVCEFLPGMRIMDMGCGGGFPGIPLAIFYPEVQFTLVDSIGKKIKVVQEIAAAIGLKNVRAIHARVSDIPDKDFDFAVSRAVAPLLDLWNWAKPKIKKGHTTDLANGLICLKGGDLTAEIAATDVQPSLWEITDFFHEDVFEDKYVVWVPKK